MCRALRHLAASSHPHLLLFGQRRRNLRISKVLVLPPGWLDSLGHGQDMLVAVAIDADR